MNIHRIAWVLLIIGGLNWGLEVLGWGIASWLPLPDSLFDIVYLLVGVSAIYELANHKKLCRDCGKM